MVRDKQKRIPGSYDEPSEAVLQKGQVYVDLLYGRMQTQEEENVARAELIELMQAEGLEEFSIDGYELKRQHRETEKIVVKKVADDEAD